MKDLMEVIPVSPNWDHQKTISVLCHKCDDVYIHMHYRHHHSDNGYGGIVVFIPHEDDADGYTIVTTDEDGICYDGDHYGKDILSNPDVYKVSTMEAFTILEKWRKLMIAREDLEQWLVSSPIDQDCINIRVEGSYTIENSR